MEEIMITEFVKFKVLETTTNEQLISKSDFLTNFQKKLDGFVDGELVKNVQENAWCLIYHYESMEKVKALGEKLRSSKEFGEFIALIVPGSLNVSFNNQLMNW
jgi:hypothetical protein